MGMLIVVSWIQWANLRIIARINYSEWHSVAEWYTNMAASHVFIGALNKPKLNKGSQTSEVQKGDH